MSKTTISLICIIGGVILMILSVSADLIGIGIRPGIGAIQLAGLVIGLAALIFGIWYWRARGKSKK